MVSGRRAAPLRAVSALALLVAGVVEALVHYAVLNGEIVAVGRVHVFLHRPSEHAVVEYKVGAVLRSAGLVLLAVAGAEAYVAHDEVFRTAEVHLVAHDAYAVAWGRLSCQRPVGTLHAQVAVEAYLAVHGKHDGERFARILAEGPSQRAFVLGVGQRRNRNHLSAASASGIFAEAFGSGEGHGRYAHGHSL